MSANLLSALFLFPSLQDMLWGFFLRELSLMSAVLKFSFLVEKSA